MTQTADQPQTFQNKINRSLMQTPANKTFLNSADKNTLSYGELYSSSLRAVSFFRSLKLPNQSRVLVFSKKEDIVTTLFIAALLEGMTTIVADSESVADETINTCNAAKPDLIVIDQEFLSPDVVQMLKNFSGRVVTLPSENKSQTNSPFEDLQALLAQFPETNPSCNNLPSDTALIVFTSGTTSKPKGVQLTFGNLAAQMDMFEKVYKFDDQSHLLNLLPLHHVDGLIRGLLAPLYFQSEVSRPCRFQLSHLPDIAGMIEKSEISHLILVPTILSLIDRMDSSFDAIFQTAHFKFIICSADHLNADLWGRFENRFKTVIVNSYGLSETVCDSLFCGPGKDFRKVGTLGKPIGCDVKLHDADGKSVSTGEIGEICIKGPHIMKGYFEQPTMTSEVLRDGWFATGDLASLDQDGFFIFEGRKKNIIVTGGTNIHPENINKVLLRHDKINEVATIGLADDIWGQIAISCIVQASGKGVSEIDVMGYCREHISAEKTPHAIIFLDALPKVPSGKIDMTLLQETATIQFERSKTSNVDNKPDVFNIASACFRVSKDDLSPQSTPYNTKGWDSLAHLTFITTLEEAFAIELSPIDIINLNSLEDAIEIIDEIAR